jgi:predicted aconitase
MRLTDEEKRMVNGEFGEAVQYSMQILHTLGEMYEAERLVEIHSAHLATSYPHFWASIDLAESFAKKGGRVKVPSTVNTAHWPTNFNRWPGLPESPEHIERAQRMIHAVQKIGAVMTCSCIPYLHGNLPRFGENVAWTESSAISFANSVLGARANRLTDGLEKAAAITGRLPCFGLLMEENRKGNASVKVEYSPRNLTDYGTIGYIIGKNFGDKVPVIEGLPPQTTAKHLKVLGAAAAGSGAVALYHCVGLTPEAKTRAMAFGRRKPEFEIKIGPQEMANALADINTAKESRFDAVFLGCPHPHIEEVQNLAALLAGRRVKPDIKLWMFISADVLAMARQLGYAQVIEEAGAEFLERTCILFFDIKGWGWKTVMTDSAKFANLLPSEPTCLNVIYADTNRCVEAATDRR